MGVENLNKIFNPKSIAVVGASEKKESVGYKLLYNLVNAGYKGDIHPVNPGKEATLDYDENHSFSSSGLRCHGLNDDYPSSNSCHVGISQFWRHYDFCECAPIR